MKHALLFAAVICIANCLSAQNPDFIWAKQIGGTTAESEWETVTDGAGNIFSTGEFWGTVDFDPGAGTYNLTSLGQSDFFISRLDSSGNFVWAKAIGGTSIVDYDKGYGIALDASGNVYTTGQFSGTADFNPGAGTYDLTSAAYSDAFVLKLNPSGNFIWAKQLRGTQNESGLSIATDAAGNVYTAVHFLGTCDFDPGPGVYNLTPSGGVDGAISKLDASGNFVWAKQFIGASSGDQITSVITDAAANVYAIGHLWGTVDFDPGAGTYNLTSFGVDDVYICKLDASGSFLWVKQLGGTDSEGARAISVDGAGNVLTTGTFYGTSDFDPGPGTFNLNSTGWYSMFVSKLDASGNFVWVKGIGTGTAAWDIITDTHDNIFLTGHFTDTVDFDPGPGIFNLMSAGAEDIFVTKLDSFGNFVWTVGIGGNKLDVGHSIAEDAASNIYVAGTFSGTVDFDPGVGNYILSSAGGSDIFVLKLADNVNQLICDIPIGEYTNAVTNHSAKVHWEAVSTANKYKVRYRVTGTNPWTNVATTNTFKKLINLTSSTQYDWQVRSVCTDLGLGNSGWSATQNFTTLPMRSGDDEPVSSFEVYPNPVSSTATISFSLEENSQTTLELFDLAGRKIKTLLDENLEPGNHEVQLDRGQLSAGVYLLQLKTPTSMVASKVLIE